MLYLNTFQGYLEEGIFFILTASEATKSSDAQYRNYYYTFKTNPTPPSKCGCFTWIKYYIYIFI